MNVSKNTLDDSTLLALIARHRDEAAFEEVVRRYEKPAFNLAKMLLKSREEAEEAVHYALFEVWRCASTYEPGNARGWIMALVARRCHKLGQKRIVERKSSSLDQLNLDLESSRPSLNELTNRRELIEVLRFELTRLSPSQRALVAFYFGSALSYAQIGEVLGMPQRTVGFKIQRILEQLRRKLKTNGFASALTLLNAEGLYQALVSGETIPEGLHARLMKGFSRSSFPEDVDRIRRVPGKGLRTLWIAGFGVTLAVAASVVWKMKQAAPPPSGLPATTLPRLASNRMLKTAKRNSASEPLRFHRRWTFPGTAPDVFESQPGSKFRFNWKAGQQGLEITTILIREKLPFVPLKISMRGHPLIGFTSTTGLGFTDGRTRSYLRKVDKRAVSLKVNEEMIYTVYYFEGISACFVNGQRFTVAETERLPNDHLIFIEGRNFLLLELEIDSIAHNEIPVGVRKYGKRSAAIERLPFGARQPLWNPASPFRTD